jgi:CheY-like chemotaxis protein
VKTVLVVDDDKLIRRIVHDALTYGDKWTVLEAEDGVDGVARFMLHHPDVLITDISMPNSDGFEMLNVLRKGGLLNDVRVVMMSGVLNMETLRAKSIGAAALLSKPFTLKELYDAVGQE